MSVSKKDIEAIAASIASVDMSGWPFPITSDRKPLTQPETERLRGRVALMMADTLVSQSDGFDPIRFVRSCGVKDANHQGGMSDLAISSHSKRLQIRTQAMRQDRRVQVTG